METGTVHFEAWVPAGGFKLEKRKGKTADGAVLTTDWLVPAWAEDELAAAHPLSEQPCLHRVLATWVVADGFLGIVCEVIASSAPALARCDLTFSPPYDRALQVCMQEFGPAGHDVPRPEASRTSKSRPACV
jgi:hypothetical protein